MASSNAFVFGMLLTVLVVSSSVQAKRPSRQQLRPTRDFQDMRLAVATGFGKRAANTHTINQPKSPPDIEWVGRTQRGFQDMPLSIARGFGKRNMDTQDIKNFLLQWFALEAKMRNRQKNSSQLMLNE